MRSVLAIALCLVSLPAQVRGASQSGDESAVREVVRKYVESRERGDAAAVRALFTADADQLTSSGEWRKGREDVVRGSLASSQSNAGKRTIAIDAVRFPAPGLAIADGAYTIAESEQAGARLMRTSFVMVREAGTWRITAIRNMLPATAR